MISILRHVRLGDFTLHSGQRSEVLFDVQSMLCDPKLRTEIVAELEKECKVDPFDFDNDWRTTVSGKFRLMGIELGGALLAALIAEKMCVPLVIYRPAKHRRAADDRKAWSELTEQERANITGTLVGELNEGDGVILIDDVITTHDSMAYARAAIAGRQAKVIKEICAVDRRELRV